MRTKSSLPSATIRRPAKISAQPNPLADASARKNARQRPAKPATPNLWGFDMGGSCC